MCTGCEVFVKIQKKWGGRGSRGGFRLRGGGGQGRCERRSEIFVKKIFFWGGGRVGGGGQGGCERRIEVFVKIQKKIGVGVRVGGVRGVG